MLTLGMTPGERIALSFDAAALVALPVAGDHLDVRAALGGWWSWLWTTPVVGRC